MFIKLTRTVFVGGSTEVERGEMFFVNASTISAVTSDRDSHSEVRAGGNLYSCFESVPEVMEAISNAEKRQ